MLEVVSVASSASSPLMLYSSSSSSSFFSFSFCLALKVQAAGEAADEDLIGTAQACSAEISAAFCSVAEIYLTDLCMEDAAQDTCISLVERALQYDPQNIQAMQVGCFVARE